MCFLVMCAEKILRLLRLFFVFFLPVSAAFSGFMPHQGRPGQFPTKDGTIGQSPHNRGHGLRKPSSDARCGVFWRLLFFRSPYFGAQITQRGAADNRACSDSNAAGVLAA